MTYSIFLFSFILSTSKKNKMWMPCLGLAGFPPSPLFFFKVYILQMIFNLNSQVLMLMMVLTMLMQMSSFFLFLANMVYMAFMVFIYKESKTICTLSKMSRHFWYPCYSLNKGDFIYYCMQ